MYSGTTFRRDSGRLAGVHQKIDRVSRRHLAKLITKDVNFPSIRQILHFEGKNGPDGIKLKSPLQDEYEHVIDPTDSSDDMLLTIIHDHIINLSKAIAQKDEIRASFESAWLAHAVVDGLTPPHHYRIDDVTKNRWLESINRSVKKNKSPDEFPKKVGFLDKWGSWGNSGITAHVLFEWGVASVVMPIGFRSHGPSSEDVVRLKRDGFEKMYLNSVHKVHELRMYEDFCKNGWTRGLALKTKQLLVPEIIKCVTLAWYTAIENAKR